MNVRPELAAAAAAWVVRLSVDAETHADWEAFSAWLASDPQARDAYDRALAVWLIPSAVAAPAPTQGLTRAPSRRWALAASIAALVVAGGGAGLVFLHATATSVLQTRPSEQRSFLLADGSRVTLGQDSEVVAEFTPRLRRVVMKRGDADFEVAGQAPSPLRVIVGDDALTVAQTRFRVHRRDGRLEVVVREGAVAVGPASGGTGPRVNLTSGSVLHHVEGTQTFQVGAADPNRPFPGAN